MSVLTAWLASWPWWVFVLLACYVWVAAIVYNWQRATVAVGTRPQWFESPVVVGLAWPVIVVCWIVIWFVAIVRGGGRF